MDGLDLRSKRDEPLFREDLSVHSSGTDNVGHHLASTSNMDEIAGNVDSLQDDLRQCEFASGIFDGLPINHTNYQPGNDNLVFSDGQCPVDGVSGDSYNAIRSDMVDKSGCVTGDSVDWLLEGRDEWQPDNGIPQKQESADKLKDLEFAPNCCSIDVLDKSCQPVLDIQDSISIDMSGESEKMQRQFSSVQCNKHMPFPGRTSLNGEEARGPSGKEKLKPKLSSASFNCSDAMQSSTSADYKKGKSANTLAPNDDSLTRNAADDSDRSLLRLIDDCAAVNASSLSANASVDSMDTDTDDSNNIPFAVKDCALITMATGIKVQTLREFASALKDIPLGSIYHHFWGRLLQPLFDCDTSCHTSKNRYYI